MKGALITGGARRIGATVTRALASDGWHVIVHYATSRRLAESICAEIAGAGGRATPLAADLADAAAAERLVADAFAAEPDLSLVVNNASTFAYDTPATATASALATSFAVNTVAPILVAREAAALMRAQSGGSIINILDNRVVAPNPDYFSYAVSKHALLGATRMMALAFAPDIRVNAIAPGITMESGGQDATSFAAAHVLNPLRRGCTPEDIAAAVRFIAATPAMTGEVITIDGGLSLANPGRDVAFLDPGAK